MSLRASVRTKADEVVEVPAYEMETYELTQEDQTLAQAFRLNAGQARRHPHHVLVHNAQRRAVCLAKQVERYNAMSPRPSPQRRRDDTRGFHSETTVCSGDETMPDQRSTRDSSGDGIPCGGCGITEHETSQSRDAMVRERGWNISTRFWRRCRSARARVLPESDSSAMQRQSEGRRKERVTQTSRFRRMMNSVMRRTSNGQSTQMTRFDSVFLEASSGAAERHCDSFDNAMSDDFADESVLPGNPTISEASIGKGLLEPNAVIQKGRASTTAKA
eukprot:TRINITY_DN13225_c0_g5_i1.p1 TRINITY_DN13225_c0_g5~~TRINITY_DN13225_c0_g5_i1.p1  ORF type:complete len:275 (-),score=16.52 TRINITY_DN13225_c0_g5_i1:152-976(-)